MERSWNDTEGGKPKNWKKTSQSATLPTTVRTAQ